ncbi:unnamed protein product [Dovyalis caffra]|uniref:ENT domain-containing protein n=1 Tax=Dovyalis caffra TaxID=77055 RepID=A0AAV1SLS4_9ROSI|nr:unnamed protein product [Dovyalis caffra]
MKFKKGSRVEVLRKTDEPSGAWQSGEIISGNGKESAYWVRYDCPWGLSNEDDLERVSRKVIRPCPPPADASDGWAAGDLVEVFNDLSWKTAAVLKAMSGDYYLVRLVGSSTELQLKKVNIRLRQLWKDGKWIGIGKGTGSCENMKSNKPSTLRSYQKMRSPMLQANRKRKVQEGDNCLAVENNTGFQATCASKRASPFCPSEFVAYTRKVEKMRAIKKRSEDQRGISGYPSSLLKKVDAVAYPQECLGEIYMHASSKNQTIGSNEMERGTPNYFVDSFCGRRVDPNDSGSDACSVGSCSVASGSPSNLFGHNVAGNSPDADNLSSDAESFYGIEDGEEKYSFPLGEDVAAGIHRLELHAYRCTIEALYASGPLSWEQEALLTNLRISLNISNDEHLVELRNLISTRRSIHIS